MRTLLAFLALAAPAQAAAPSIEDGSAARALAAARAQWKAHGFASYSMHVQPSCFCAPAYTRERRVIVRNGKVVHAADPVRPYASVPRLFGVIRRAIDKRYDGLRVRYGATGLPREISLDPSTMVADDELTIQASHLRALG